MKSEILRNLIQRIIEVEPNESPLISCFVNLEQPRSDYYAIIENMARLVSQRLRGERLADFEDALSEIKDYLSADLKPSSKGVVIYARWGDHPVFIPVQFEVPLENDFIVDTIPHIYPVVELRDTFHRFVTVITTESEARILETSIGSVTEEILAERPQLRERIGREWTREHYHNHKDKRDSQFVKEKIRIIEELMNRRGHSHLLIAGSPKMASRLTNALPPALRDKLITTLPMNPKSGISPILQEAIHHFAAAENLESHDHVKTLETEVFRNRLGVAGYEESREAILGGYADMLIVDQDYTEIELREELTRLATASGIRIETVNRSETLERLSGVGCLLRYRPNKDAGQVKIGALTGLAA